MTSPTGKVIQSSSTVLSDGSYTIFLYPASDAETGTWIITVTSLGQTQSLSVVIQPSGSTTGTTTFTDQTTLSTYARGQPIIVLGIGQVGTQASAFLTGPTGIVHSIINTVQPDSTYNLVFSTTTTDPAGSYSIVVTNNQQSKTLTISLN
jgi:hypothetical protein